MGKDTQTPGISTSPLFFQQLLKVIFPFAPEKVLVLGDEHNNIDHIPLPPEWAVQLLPGSVLSDATYLEQLQERLSEKKDGCVVFMPPFMGWGRLPQDLKKQYPQLDLSIIMLINAAKALQPGVSLGVWLPTSFLYQRDLHNLLPNIQPRFLLNWDLTVPKIAAKILLLFLVIDKDKNSTLMRFFQCPEIPPLVETTGAKVPNVAREQAILKDLQRLLKKEGGATEFGYILREGIPAGELWLYERHHPQYKKQVEELSIWGGVEPLGQLVDIKYGFPLREQVNILLPAQDPAGLPVLQASHIGLDNKLSLEDIQHKAVTNKVEPYQLQVNDICLRADLASDGKIKAVKVEAHMLPLVHNETVLVLRPKVDRNVPIDFLLAYLQSGQILIHLKSAGVASRLYPSSLETLVVPMYDDEISQMVGELKEAAGVFGQWQEETQKVMHFLFTEQATKEVRGKFVTDGRVISQRVKVAQQISDLGYRLRTGLPHPLALRWRKAEIARPNAGGYNHVLGCAEVLICYLALLGSALMRSMGQPVTYITDTLGPRLTNNHRGTGFGDWTSIVKELCRNKEKPDLPMPEFFTLLQDAQIEEKINLLAKNRNDNAHGREPNSTFDYEEKLKESREALVYILKAAEFLTEYPLVYIESTKRDSLTGVTSYQYHSLMGDHALVPSQTGETVFTDLEAESLYLRDKRGNFYLLRPFLLRLEQKNGQWGTFFIDTYTTEKKCQFKSLEDGRVMMVSKIEPVLKHVGLLG